ncbi:MAG: agmatine deiminase family protein [Calditerrivibrio sp.]|nr:agmatine deiminase family protein [Calditerrivibrio sp.]MCA1932436.1 agmatine deiminase family protein [Calditerrivibrio sp.]MCA1980890.1 agmatine deiminase family protein [Calditerrivibrio sp.]
MKSERFFPAEWYEQSCVQLTWPHVNTDWSGYLIDADDCFLDIARHISEREKLIIVCSEIDRVKVLTKSLNTRNIIYLNIPNNDTWARDHGGITVFENGYPVIMNFQFNGWGLKFPSNLDNQITRKIFERSIFGKNVKLENHLDFVLEGGSIESDGRGVLLTTSNCLLSENRNEMFGKEIIEERLKNYFNVRKILWLEHGFLEGDDTDSHIDTLARFCDEKTICYVKCDDEDDIHYNALKSMEEQLLEFTDLNSRKYDTVPLPMAEPMYHEDERLPATYANFLIINDAVLVPVYGSKKDSEAIDILKNIFKGRDIIPIDCSVLVRQHGSLHCVTMQYPKGVLDE